MRGFCEDEGAGDGAEWEAIIWSHARSRGRRAAGPTFLEHLGLARTGLENAAVEFREKDDEPPGGDLQTIRNVNAPDAKEDRFSGGFLRQGPKRQS